MDVWRENKKQKNTKEMDDFEQGKILKMLMLDCKIMKLLLLVYIFHLTQIENRFKHFILHLIIL